MAVYWVTVTDSYKIEAETPEEARELLERHIDGVYVAEVRHKDSDFEIEAVY